MSWRCAAPLPEPRCLAAAVALADGDAILLGGTGSPMPAPVLRYVATEDRWRAAGELLKPRGFHQASPLADGRILVTGGIGEPVATDDDDNRALAEVELYDPTTERSVVVDSMHSRRAEHTATVLHDGRVLVTGGADFVDERGSFMSTTASVEVYSPGPGSWTVLSSLARARARHAAVEVPGGEVVVIGGWATEVPQGDSSQPPALELYDPVAGRSLSTLLPGVAWDAPGAALLADGRVAVLASTATSAETGLEVFDPRTDSLSKVATLVHGRSGDAPRALVLTGGALLVVGGGAEPEVIGPVP